MAEISRPTKRQRVGEAEIDWADLPATAIRLITLAAGKSGLNFCATCKAYRAAQPPLRVLVINLGYNLGYNWKENVELSWISKAMKEEFCVVIENNGTDAHRLVESLPLRYAQEISHLALQPVHGFDYARAGPALLLEAPLRQYGKNPRSLRMLHLEQRSTLYGNPRSRQPLLKDCALQLVRATKRTLRELSISASAQFLPDTAQKLFTDIGLEKLQRLSLNLVPSTFVSAQAVVKGRESDSRRLRDLAKAHCAELLQPARIICHHCPSPWLPIPSWMGASLARSEEYDPDTWRNSDAREAFFQRHACLYPEESQVEATRDRPGGYSGKWCGNFNFCEQQTAASG